MPTDEQADVEALVGYLKIGRGFDLSTYKPTTLTRRIRRRMTDVSVTSFSDYRDYLEVHPEEFEALVNTILINVTSFFREPATWTFLREQVLPTVLSNNPDGAVRCWSAGCATGEEAYTVAMLLAEALGPDEFRSRVKIYATDVDEEALATARQGTYSAQALEAVPEHLREKYFEPAGDECTFRGDLRRSIIFGRHDLTQDAPISRLDLLISRNTLMYFNAEAQAAIVRRMYFALKPSGFLFLGKAETLMSHASLFLPFQPAMRFFTKTPDPYGRPPTDAQPSADAGIEAESSTRLLSLAQGRSHLPQIVLDERGRVTALNDRARAEFRVDDRDVGRMFQDLTVSYEPLELRTAINEAHRVNQPVQIEDNTGALGSATSGRRLRVMITPLPLDKDISGTLIEFVDVSRESRLQEELSRVSEELETAYEELQSTNEELETAYEELQSTNEELETTNEELQSTVEELETTNEELRSTNEELEAMNDQLRERTDQVTEANVFLSSTVNSLNVAVVVLDNGETVHTWSTNAEEYWGLREDEVLGQSFFTLDIGLPVAELRQPVTDCLEDTAVQQVLLTATNRRGRTLRCHVTCSPLTPYREGGVVLVMHEEGEPLPV